MGRKRWKIERFSTDIIPDLAKTFDEFKRLSLKDAAILASSNIDIALAELIDKRLNDSEGKKVEFLGTD